MMKPPIASSDIQSLYKILGSGPGGLSTSDAINRHSIHGQREKETSRFSRELRLFVRQFTNPLVLLLLVAVLLSAVLGEQTEALIIGVILLATGLMGFFQERHAGRSLEKLRQLTQTSVQVFRDGQTRDIPSRDVVEGDMILLNAGDMIPADCRIVESNELHVNESALTGESFPVEKAPGQYPEDIPTPRKTNCLWHGTSVISGTAKALAVYTGKDTTLGKLAGSLATARETVFEKGIRQFGYFLLRITLVLSVAILAANLYFQKPFFESILFSLALAVGMAPELLPAIMTYTMSAGARKMMQQKVVVKKLSSIFNLGELGILCTDKTGTITEGTVRLSDVVDPLGKPDELLRQYACLNACFQEGFENPIDLALTSIPVQTTGITKINEVPYDFIRKRLSVALSIAGSNIIITKGAFSNVLEACAFVRLGSSPPKLMDETEKGVLNDIFARFCNEGYRVLGLATKEIGMQRISREDEKNMTFAGFILLEDQLKEGVIPSLRKLEDLGVTVKIITGDNRFAAAKISQDIGLFEPQVLTGPEIDQMTSDALAVQALQVDIFAEIEPHQKERLVQALQASGTSIGYLGDGINDAAAINRADIGMSTNNAVAVAREAADYVLLEKDLSVIADGVIEGRKSFANSMKYVFITTGATFGNMFSVAAASLFLPFLPMLPKQILLNNLISDMPFLSIASDHVEESQLRKPQSWNIRLIRTYMIVFGIHSSLFDFLTFYLLWGYFKLSGSPFQTGWFMESGITEILILLVIRTRLPVYKSRPGRLLLALCLLAIGLNLYLPFSPFSGILGLSVAHPQQLAGIIAILGLYLVTADILKLVFFRWMESSKAKA
jgi:Mg2+-importing ATPase